MKKSKWLKYIINLTLIIYSFIFFMVNLGYYEYAYYKKKVLTEEQIEKFEKDVLEGKELDINEYLSKDDEFIVKKKRLPLKISELIVSMTSKGINIVFNYLNKLIK